MAIKTSFGNKTIALPGVYTRTLSLIKNPPLFLDYGKVLLIDTGLGAGYGLGAGIAGELGSGKSAIYLFSELSEFRTSVRGGLFWQIAEGLFKPDETRQGISQLYFASAKESIASKIELYFGDASVSDVDGVFDGGFVKVKARNEGPVGNGTLLSGKLTRGFATKLITSVSDSTKYVLQFWAGSYRGVDENNVPYDDIAEADTEPELIIQSIPFNDIAVLIDWMTNNSNFNDWFKLYSSGVTGSGRVDAADLALLSSYKLFSGGTETYSTTHLDTLLESVADLDYTFILSDRYGAHAISTQNTKIRDHIFADTTKYTKFLFLGGGKDQNKFAATVTGSTLEAAIYYDSERVHVVHAGNRKRNFTGVFKERSSLYKAAQVLGRIAGLPPQVSGTFKTIDQDSDLHELKEKEKIQALDAGVIVTCFDSAAAGYIILQSVNTLQDNQYLVNPDGTSYEVSLMRIAAQLNKELEINAKKQLLLAENGVNRNTLKPEDLKSFVDSYLSLKTATDTVDNLILSYRNIQVTVQGDAYSVTYEFEPNFPVNKLLMTGFIIDLA